MMPASMTGPEFRRLVSHSTGLEIPVIAAKGLVFSGWLPSKEDLQALQRGEPLWLVQRGEYIPEMHMIVGKKEAVVPFEIGKQAAAMLTPEVQRAAKIEVMAAKTAPWILFGFKIVAALAAAVLLALAWRAL